MPRNTHYMDIKTRPRSWCCKRTLSGRPPEPLVGQFLKAGCFDVVTSSQKQCADTGFNQHCRSRGVLSCPYPASDAEFRVLDGRISIPRVSIA